MTFAVARRHHRPWRSSANRAETWLRFWTGGGSISPRRWRVFGRRATARRRVRSVAGRRAGRRAGEICTRTWGGVSPPPWGGVSGTHLPFFAGVVRVFGPRPDRHETRQRGGTVRERPPLFDRWRGQSRGGVYQARCQAPGQYHPPPPSGGSLPSVFIPAGRLPRPACGRDDAERRARPTDEQTSSGCRPVLSEIVRNFRP